MKESDFFKTLEVKLNPRRASLKFKISKRKGSPGLTPLIKDKKEDLRIGELYKMAKNLEPFDDFKNPYWNVYYLIYSLELITSLTKFEYFNLPENVIKKITEFEGRINKKLVSYNSITGILPFNSHEFFYKYILSSKSYKTLFIFNTLHISPIEEYTIFREKNSFQSFDDKTFALELPFYITEERTKTVSSLREKFYKKFSNIDYKIFEGDICLLTNLFQLTDYLEGDLDFININVNFFTFATKKYTSYLNSQNYLNLIILGLRKLKTGGMLRLETAELNNELLFDIIEILKYFFEEVIILKPSIGNILSIWKSVVCRNYLGIEEEAVHQMEEISFKWSKITESCSKDIRKFSNEKFYPVRILEGKIDSSGIEEFNQLQIRKKEIVFNNIITTYYSLRYLDKQKIIEELQEKKISNTLYFMRKYGIDEKIPHKALDNNIIKDEFLIDFKKDQLEISLEGFKQNLKFEMSTEQYNLPELYQLENNLKFTKRILDTIDYSLYKEISNTRKKLEGLKESVSGIFGRDISQAFLKLWEILQTYNLIDKNMEKLRTFHFCEAPGQFILALSRFVKKKTNIRNFRWTAQSLNPGAKENKKYGGVFGDSYKLIKRYPERWDFGADGTGDITATKNIKYYKNIIGQSNLITSDCGLDMTNPTSAVYQDKGLAYVNFCQILMCLNGIKIGAHYVSKVFLPQTHPFIVGMNFILHTCFEKVFYHKSLINLGSSEFYLVCKNFQGVDESTINQLFKLKTKFTFHQSFIKIPKTFLDNYTKIIRVILTRHINHTKTNIYYYDNPSGLLDVKKIEEIKKRNVENWIKFFKFR